MKLESKYFDQIRVKPSAPREAEEPTHVCQWKGCRAAGAHKAPMGRGRENEYYHFCLDHVRQFNASYNYFAGMSDAEVEDFRKGAITGHRPTWKLGADTPISPAMARTTPITYWMTAMPKRMARAVRRPVAR